MTGPGANSNIIDQVRQQVGWTVARPLPGALPAIENGQDNSGVFPQFRSDNDGPPGTLMQGNGFSTLNGLPANNSAFGANSVTHNLQGAPLDVANIEVFYNAVVSTHPAGGPPGYDQFHTHDPDDPDDPDWPYSQPMDTPNWFFYYDQVWQNQWQIPVAWYNDGTAYYWEGSDHVHVGNFSHGDSTPNGYGTQLFAIVAGSGSPWVQHVGYEDVRGIDNYMRTVTHECVHKRLWEDIHLAGKSDLDPNPVTLLLR